MPATGLQTFATALARVFTALLMGLALSGLIASAADAQTSASTPALDPDERVELILTGLPPPDTPAYKALFAHAGDAEGQILSMTQCEMWSVRRRHLEVLKREASKINVAIQELGEDWNVVLEPMSPASPVGGTTKAMMETAMQSRATASVGMMGARAANVVEYALTKGMNQQGGTGHPMSVRIAVNEQTAITAVRRSVEIKGNRCIWRGVVEGTEQPVTIMWWASGRMTGSIHHNNRVYQLKQMDKDVIGIVETMVDKMPDEHPSMTPERMREMKKREDARAGRGGATPARPRRGETKDQEDDASGLGSVAPSGVRSAFASVKAASPAPVKSRKENAAAAKPAKSVIDIMVVYTAKAAQHFSDIKLDLIELAVEDTNQSFRDSGAENVEVRLVHVHKSDYDETTGEHFDHVWRMVDRGDGFLEEVPSLRDKHKADVVLLIVDDARGCGLATRVAADATEAYAVVHHECVATTYSFAHEVGHIIGARHDRLIDQAGSPFPFGHGFIEPGLQWRTMMSYKRGCNGCPRLPIWSTPASVVNGKPAGDELQNNARVIRENAARVAAFR